MAIFVSNGIKFKMDKLGNLTIVGYTGSKENLIIPDEVAGHNATKIAAGAFRDSRGERYGIENVIANSCH